MELILIILAFWILFGRSNDKEEHSYFCDDDDDDDDDEIDENDEF